MTNQVNIDELAKKFFAAQGEKTYGDLFGAVFALPSWHFIAVGEMPNLSPYCAIFPDFGNQPLVAAFTDTEKLNEYIIEENLKNGSAEQPITINSTDAIVKMSSENLILSIPTTSVINYLEALTDKDIKGIFFNPNKFSHGFHLGLPQLQATKELVENNKIKTESEENTEKPKNADEVDFDALSRKVNESNGALDDLNKLFGAAYALDEWIFIARGELPHVNPYVAARADYQNGQQMIRAFTDSNRLLRFARENKLTNANGSAEMLTIPTKGVVEYLEQFIKNGVGGVWFNSDTKSDGFSIPLQQLRPIKEHLAKLNQPPPITQKANSETVIIIINDGLMLPSGFVKKSDYTCNLYCLVPQNWTENEQLKDEFLEKFFEKMYGAAWRGGNSDGSQYVVDNSFSTILTAEQLKGANWTTTKNTAENYFWFYVAGANGEIAAVQPTGFQAEFEAARHLSAQQNANLEDFGLRKLPDGTIEQILVKPDGETFTAARKPQPTALEKWGVNVSAGETDSEIRVLSPGNVKFGITLVPFYAAVTQRLKDYQGSGDFNFIFGFPPESVKNLTENITSNDHGTYFRVRKFQHHAPNVPPAEAATIDSNQLRHIQTGEKLLVSFVLLQIPESQSAVLYFGMKGNRSEIDKLLQAITPALEGAGFVPERK